MMKNNQGAKQQQVVGTPTRMASSAQHAASKKSSPMFYLDLNSPDKNHIVDIDGNRIGISLPVISSYGNAEHDVNNTQATQATQAAAPARVQFTVTSDAGYKRKLFVEDDEEMDIGVVTPLPMRFTGTGQVLRQRMEQRFPGGMPQLLNEFPGGPNELKAKHPELFRFSSKKPS